MPIPADQSPAVAPLVPAKLRRGREPGTHRHRTIPALEPVRRQARATADGNADAETRHRLIPDPRLPCRHKPDGRSSFDEQRRQCALSTGSAVVYAKATVSPCYNVLSIIWGTRIRTWIPIFRVASSSRWIDVAKPTI